MGARVTYMEKDWKSETKSEFMEYYVGWGFIVHIHTHTHTNTHIHTHTHTWLAKTSI
jgi:hypothetical protein